MTPAPRMAQATGWKEDGAGSRVERGWRGEKGGEGRPTRRPRIMQKSRHDKIIFMQPSLAKLRKYFRLEHENGYNNTAIIGGLSKMLDYWEGEARADTLSEEVIQAVVQRLRSYDSLAPQSRAD